MQLDGCPRICSRLHTKIAEWRSAPGSRASLPFPSARRCTPFLHDTADTVRDCFQQHRRTQGCSLREDVAVSSRTLSQMHSSWDDNARKPMRHFRATMHSSLNKTGSGDGMECS